MITNHIPFSPVLSRLNAAVAMVFATTLTAHAAIVVAGPQTYTQSFDSLPAAGDVPWVDDATVPGFIAEVNDDATADGDLKATDGSAPLNGLLNLGAALSPERALGSKSTSSGGFANIAYGVLFQNTSAIPLTVLQDVGRPDHRPRIGPEFWNRQSGIVHSGTRRVELDVHEQLA